MIFTLFSSTFTRAIRTLSLGFFALSLAACATTVPLPQPPPVSHAPSPAEVAAQQQFFDCKQDALALDVSAYEQQSPAQYNASAKTLDHCLSDIDDYRHVVPLEARMQVHALTVLNYLKGGDITKAREQLRSFELSYPDSDLYFSDYTSFVDSLRVILRKNAINRRVLNINPMLASEIVRHRYWQTH
ncbi:MAG: hypothetical protein COA99_14260 [Moraxellaceae bacterium]|nr:MAG: hypothetical protein COA99_14260 [Moraxellaceae bacterium]